MCRRRPLLLYNKPMSHPCEAFPLSVYRVTFIISPLRIAQEPLLKVRTGGFQYFDAKGAPVPGNEIAGPVEKTTTARWDGMRWIRLYQIARNNCISGSWKDDFELRVCFSMDHLQLKIGGENRNRCSESMCGRLPCCYYVCSLFVHCSMIKLVKSSTSFL